MRPGNLGRANNVIHSALDARAATIGSVNYRGASDTFPLMRAASKY